MIPYRFDRQTDPHPVLLSARQVAANQILLSYDQRTDLDSAMKVNNYWIRSNAGPNGAASIDMGDALGPTNAVSMDAAVIRPADGSKMNFTMTFRNTIPPGTLYIVLPCYVNLEGRTGFTGRNWGPSSMNMFIGM